MATLHVHAPHASLDMFTPGTTATTTSNRSSIFLKPPLHPSIPIAAKAATPTKQHRPTPATTCALAIPELLLHILFCLDNIELCAAAHDALLLSTQLKSSSHHHHQNHTHQRTAGTGTRPSSKQRLGSTLRSCSLVSKFWHLASGPVLWRRVSYSKSNSLLAGGQSLGRFLPGLVKFAPFIRHLKPWPGFLDRDLDLMGVYCGATLETLDLAYTRWGGSRARYGSVKTTATSTTTAVPGSTMANTRQQSPGYKALATTESLIELLPQLKRLKTLTLDSSTGLDMPSVLKYLTDLYNNNSSSDSINESSSSSSNTIAEEGTLNPRWPMPLRRVDMDCVQNIDEGVFIAFLEACGSTHRREPQSSFQGRYRQHEERHVLYNNNSNEFCVRSISIRRNDLSSFSFDFSKSVQLLLSTSHPHPLLPTLQPPPPLFHPHPSTLNPTTTNPMLHDSYTAFGATPTNSPQLAFEELALDETSISDVALKNLSRHCPWLRELSLSNNLRLTCAGLESLACHSPLLEKVNLEGCIGIREWGFECLFGQCLQLKDLRLSNTHVTDRALLVLLGPSDDDTDSRESSRPGTPGSVCSRPSSPSPSLEDYCFLTRHRHPHHRQRPPVKAERIQSLSLSRCSSITDDSVNAVLKRCRNLQTLDISMNRQLHVAKLFWHNTDAYFYNKENSSTKQQIPRSRSGTVDGTCSSSTSSLSMSSSSPLSLWTSSLYWACSQSLQVLNISSINYSMLPVSPSPAVTTATSSTSTSTLSSPSSSSRKQGRSHSRQGSMSSTFVPYSALYNQLQQLSGLQSLTMGSMDFVLDLYHDPAGSALLQTQLPTSTPASSSSPTPSSSPPWNMFLGAATATSTAATTTSSITTPSYSPGLVRVCQSLQRLQTFTLTKIDPLSSSLLGFKELRWMIQNMSSGSIRQLCVGQGVGLAVGFGNSLVESGRKSNSSRGESLVLFSSTTQDRMSKMDQVDRDMDHSEQFMAWCRTARPNLSIKVLEW